jgi:hypothetical protein
MLDMLFKLVYSRTMNSGGHMTTLNISDKVTGTYCGFGFSGKITERRCHSMNSSLIYTVTLDQPIEVFGDTREVIAVTTGCEGNSIRAA